MKRREFFTVLGGVAASACSPVVYAQQSERVRRVGALMSTGENDPEERSRLAAFVQRLTELGWIDGRNLRLEVRWGSGDDERNRRYASDLVALTPDVILADTSQVVITLQKATRTIPIVFAGGIDPVGAGIVDSLARPGGNATGFTAFEFAISAKWIDLLREAVPQVTRVAVLRDPSSASGIGQFAAIQTVAPMGVELSVVSIHGSTDAIERAVATFARRPNGGLVVTASPFGRVRRDVITALASQYKLPSVYPFRYYVTAGGLVSYGPNLTDLYRPAAGYVDRILKGERPEELPVQAPTSYELVINLKTAKTLGIEMPPSLLARADEVIE